MKTIILNGSPRKNWNTALMLKETPGPEAVEQFVEKLDEFGLKYSKGSIQIPYSDNLPIDLISAIAAWCRDTGNHA